MGEWVLGPAQGARWRLAGPGHHPPLSLASGHDDWGSGARRGEQARSEEGGGGAAGERERRHESAVRSQESHDPSEGHDYPGRWRHPAPSRDQTSTDSIRGHTTRVTLSQTSNENHSK